MSRFLGLFAVAGIVAFAMVFAAQNGMERVTLRLGIFALYGVPVTLVAFGGFFLGMVLMLGAGVQADLKARAILRQRLKADAADAPTLADQSQVELFLPGHPSLPPTSSDAGVSQAAPVFESSDSWEAPEVSIADLAPDRGTTAEVEPPLSGADPSWRDMEHGDWMD